MPKDPELSDGFMYLRMFIQTMPDNPQQIGEEIILFIQGMQHTLPGGDPIVSGMARVLTRRMQQGPLARRREIGPKK